MKNFKQVIFILLLCCSLVFCTQPTGCSYDSSDSSTGIFNCVYGSYTPPLTFNTFSDPYPQRLIISGMSGTLATNTFSGFSSFSTSLFDLDYSASLEIICSSGGSLTISAATFTDMGYLQELKIRNCDISSLPANVFSNIGTLDTLTIEGGSIASLNADSLGSLTISRLDIPIPAAAVVMKNTAITGNVIPAGMFNGLTTAKSIELDNVGLTSIDNTLFSLNTALTSLSLANNGITSVESSLISALEGLSSLNLDGIAYDCSCTNLWILTYARTNGIDIPTGIVCNSPADYQNKKAIKYYNDVCDTEDACGSMPGIVLGPTICMTIIEMVSYGLLAVILIIAVVALVLICHTRHKLVVAKENLEKKRNSSWARVQNALKKGGASGQKPPMKSSQVDGWV